MASVADIASLWVNILTLKIIKIDAWKPWFYANPDWVRYIWLVSGFCLYYQSLLHLSIAINRVWTSFSFVAKSDALPLWGGRIIWVLPFISIAILSPRIPGRAVFVYTAEGELASGYVDTSVALYHSIAGPVVVVTTCAISFVLSIITMLRYRQISKQYTTVSSTMKQDILLFGQAFVVLLFQVALAAYFAMRVIATTQSLPALQAFALMCYEWISDAANLCNPILLLILCKSIRNDYVSWIFFRDPGIKIVSSTITQTRIQSICIQVKHS
uniref:Serpentine receptor class gamma n=1 Tax=Panagrolaimus davidi TaxID=227884 RepID=A0A914PK44_9BILA